MRRAYAPAVHDPGFPLAVALLGGGAGDLVATALAGQGGRLEALRARQVLYVPGDRITVTYAAEIRWPGSAPSTGRLVVGAIARRGAAPDDLEVRRFPDDPALPGLGSAVEPDRVRALLDAVGAPAGRPSLTVRAYRPGRRAVVEVDLDAPGIVLRRDRSGVHASSRGRKLFLKVLPPARAAAVAATHDRLDGHVPVARCTPGPAGLGVLVLDALPGRSLGRAAARGDASLPSLADLVAALDAIPAGPGLPVRAGPLAEAAGQARLLSAVLPDAAERVACLLDGIGEPSHRRTTDVVHGDFHEGQLLVRAGRLSGLLDVDGVGAGDRADDVATLVGRLWSLAHPEGRHDPKVGDYTLALWREATQTFDQDDLRRRAAAVLLGRATGPFRRQRGEWWVEAERRIALAEAWLAHGPHGGGRDGKGERHAA